VIKQLSLLLLITIVSCGQTTESKTPAQTKSSGLPLEAQNSTAPSASSTSPQPLPSIPAGWQWITGGRAKIAVPPNYVGGSPENLQAIAANLPEVGLDESTLVELLGRYVSPTNLFGIDRTTLTKAFPTNFSVALDGKPQAQDLDSYLASAVQELAGDWQVQKQEKITLGHRQFARIRAVAQQASVTATIYITKDAGKFWLMTFTTENGASNGAAEDFQQIAASLRSL
jgi:hypothetical protein